MCSDLGPARPLASRGDAGHPLVVGRDRGFMTGLPHGSLAQVPSKPRIVVGQELHTGKWQKARLRPAVQAPEESA